jgi:hypothetical protein
VIARGFLLSSAMTLHCVDPAWLLVACLAQVASFEKEASSDYRFNHRLHSACQDDVNALCSPLKACSVPGQVGGLYR